MKSYKCTNCGNTWESQEMPFECPKCHSAAITQLGGDNNMMSTLKKYWWIIAAAVVAAVILIVALPNGATRVKVKTDTETGRMEVTLKGKHASEYRVILEQNGYVEREDSTDNNNPVVFFDLDGEYTLKISYKGTGNAPKIRKYKTEYSFDRISNDEPSNSEADTTNFIPGVDVIKGDVPKTDRPEIRLVKVNPNRIKKGETYTITVLLSPHGPGLDKVQFSLDGVKYQESNVFAGLNPGNYTIYARNKEFESLVSSTDRTLEEPFTGNCPSLDDINALLPKIASGDSKARTKFLNLLGRETKIKGSSPFPDVSNWLSDGIGVDGVKHKVVSIDCNDGKVNSITIKEI